MTIFTSPNQNWWENPGELDAGEPGVAARAKVWFQGEVIVTRYGMLTGLKSEHVQTYKELHAAVWPDVLKTIKECSIQDYSIYLKTDGPEPVLPVRLL